MPRITAQRINALKANVKAECARRSHSGSVAAYGGTEYDFTVVPAGGVPVNPEHYDKNAVPLNAVNSDIIQKAAAANTPMNEADILAMEAFYVTLAARNRYDAAASDCRAGCTGLCFGCTGTCTDICTGCTGCWSCTGSCTGCSGSCAGTCTGCSGSCTGCSGSCEGSCTSCTGTCTNICTSCTGGCDGSCMYSCSASCYATCLGTDSWIYG